LVPKSKEFAFAPGYIMTNTKWANK
jgi:hypothetical protein